MKMNKMGKFLLNYFTGKISVKEFRKKSLVCMSLLENNPTQSYLYVKAANLHTDESALNNNSRSCRYLGTAGQDFKTRVAYAVSGKYLNHQLLQAEW